VREKASPLVDLYRAKGATLVEHEHWLLPAHFGDPLAEYHAVRTRVGLFDLCQRSLVRFTGDDRASFLNGVVSNDVTVLTSGEGLHAAFLDIHGKILADARIFCATDSLLADVPDRCKESILQHLKRLQQLKRHLVIEEVEIQDQSADYLMLSVQGPHAERLIADIAPSKGLPLVDLAHQQVTIAGKNVTLIQVTHAAERAYDLVVPIAELQDVVSRIEEVGKRWSLSWVGVEAQDMLRIEAGVPLYGVDITWKNVLLETGQDRWASLKKRLAGLVLQGKQTVQTGATIYDGEREIGSITSCRLSPHTDSAIALGYVQRDYLTPGTRVTIQEGGKSLAAFVSGLPIYQPGASQNRPS
jgi:glycine cleavage system aminomethyltransferase T